MPGVLEGIRVLDFGRYIAGPFCGTMLGDLGAEVIRIEKLEGSEDRWVTPVVEGGEGAMFLQMGRNKLGLTLNPMKPAGREIVKKLVARVRRGDRQPALRRPARRWASTTTPSRPSIRASSSPPPRPSARKAPTPRASASTRSARRCRAPCTCRATARCRPASTPRIVDFGSALLNTVGVLAALMDRAKSGKGQKVETALLRTAINITNSHLIEQAMLNLNRIATLNRGFTAGPVRHLQVQATAGSTP